LDRGPVPAINTVPGGMLVNPSCPVRTVPEFIAYAKANTGKIIMASSGIGVGPHMNGELFKLMAGVDMLHVPYRGGDAPDPEADRCLCHPVGTSQVQANAPPDQGRARLV